MSDDMLLHFSSNSSNQSDHSLPTKIAKLEARLVGKASSASSAQQPQQQQQQHQQQQPPWPSLSSASKFVSTEDLPEASSSSDSDDEVTSPYDSFSNHHCFLLFCKCGIVKMTVSFGYYFLATLHLGGTIALHFFMLFFIDMRSSGSAWHFGISLLSLRIFIC